MHDDFWKNLLKYHAFEAEFKDIGSAWGGHLAFAYLLAGELRPELLVELGTHRGHSFFAFCQSVAENRTGTACYAVDTWRGDSQAGEYDDSIYANVVLHVQHKYVDFARLLRMTFDEALDSFDDGSVDLLHIDGFHTYEAVKHDFESWYDKVRPGGIILLHDIAERHHDFGAAQFWDEISPAFAERYAFGHSHGLGVLRKPGGKALNSALLTALLDPARSEEAEAIDAFCRKVSDASYREALAENLENQNRFLTGRLHELQGGVSGREAAALREELLQKQGAWAASEAALRTREIQINDLLLVRNAAGEDAARMLRELESARTTAAALQEQLLQKEGAWTASEAALRTREIQIHDLLRQRESQAAELEAARIAAEEVRRHLTGELGALQLELGTVSGTCAELRRVAETRELALRDLERQLRELERQVRELEGRNALLARQADEFAAREEARNRRWYRRIYRSLKRLILWEKAE